MNNNYTMDTIIKADEAYVLAVAVASGPVRGLITKDPFPSRMRGTAALTVVIAWPSVLRRLCLLK